MSIFSAVGSALGGLLGGGGKQKPSAESQASAKYYQELVRLSKLNEDKNFNEAQSIYNALRDQLANPLFQQIYNQERDDFVNNNVKALMDLITVQNRARAKGMGSGLVQPERMDEFRAGLMSAAQDSANTVAKTAARDYLMKLGDVNNQKSSTLSQSANTLSTAAGGLGNLGAQRTELDIMNRNNRVNQFSGLGALAGEVIGGVRSGKSLSDIFSDSATKDFT